MIDLGQRARRLPGIDTHSTNAGRWSEGILDCIGKTPLVRLSRYLDYESPELLVKLESANPGGSAKDRPAALMLADALEKGFIDERTTIVESSSGNMGIGLAQACRYHGLRFLCVVDPHAQSQNIAIIQALGGEVVRVETPINDNFLTARIARVRMLLEENPNSFWPNQYANRCNPMAHELATIQEIDEATGGDFDYLFVATSSTGTAQGCRDYLRKRGRRTKVIAVDAEGSVLFGGTPGKRLVPGLGAGQLPELAEGQVFDRIVRVSDLHCVTGCRRASRREAMLIGGSAGGVLEAVRSLQEEVGSSRVVAILHDSGTRYLDTIFNDEWVEAALGVSRDEVSNRINEPALAPTSKVTE
ncbi:2,3-diaminopropionate biosynthesis protein SbnA [Rubinisphaera margarita]|uniref:2,3-diaminopropionate biosynthesis protein SbnA n=1 Tax=Rubinisphaera margarita TaxID=2909586 RepID=UPI001EE7BA79|nr:2,3-diaminopropionate biosynthesis protein SbnA [Rubinisphaera margarita]MCG6158223.1 2,3-diaminopropionate biosynthesis protein SbnA [Rubinisphaera margarita]